MATSPRLNTISFTRATGNEVTCSLTFRRGSSATQEFYWEYKNDADSVWTSGGSSSTSADLVVTLSMQRGIVYSLRIRTRENNQYSPWIEKRLFAYEIPSAFPEVTTSSSNGEARYTLQGIDDWTIYSSYRKAEKKNGALVIPFLKDGTSISATIAPALKFKNNEVIQGAPGATQSLGSTTIIGGASAQLATPTGLSRVISGGQVTATWDAVQNANLYEVTAIINGQTAVFDNLIKTSETEAIFNLIGDAVYNVRVRAIDTTGNYAASNYAAAVVANTSDSFKLFSPIELRTTGITENSARTNWNPVENASNYKVQYKAAGDTVWTETYTD